MTKEQRVKRFFEPLFQRGMVQISTTGCWEWMGARRKGYGLWRTDGKTQSVHRLAFRAVKGKIPEGKIVMHRCDNPACCNPDHLRAGTRSQNTLDSLRKGRFKLPDWRAGVAERQRRRVLSNPLRSQPD